MNSWLSTVHQPAFWQCLCINFISFLSKSIQYRRHTSCQVFLPFFIETSTDTTCCQSQYLVTKIYIKKLSAVIFVIYSSTNNQKISSLIKYRCPLWITIFLLMDIIFILINNIWTFQHNFIGYSLHVHLFDAIKSLIRSSSITFISIKQFLFTVSIVTSISWSI